MDQWMRDFEERQRHDELKQKMDAQTSAMNSQAIALQKQNNILQKEHERQIEKEFKVKRTAYNGQYKKVIYCSYKEVLFSWLKKEASSPNIHPSSNYR
ncbi:hypothetical protein [Streptococcus suis]|uniref:hypothetical protein n=1 Tax=Streptococcus suis TaxID=1307 RepID=UPI002876DEF9|nr:hypothetical protein [Streptococcus suis]MDS1160489.1 hypothetical protein [Streptococcus suis]